MPTKVKATASEIDLRFPDWKDDPPSAEEREAFLACCRILLRLSRDTAEIQLATTACGLWNLNDGSLVVNVVPVDRAHTIIEVRNN